MAEENAITILRRLEAGQQELIGRVSGLEEGQRRIELCVKATMAKLLSPTEIREIDTQISNLNHAERQPQAVG